MSTPNAIVATSSGHLRALVQAAMAEHGPACDLNHIDVSRLKSLKGVFKNLPFNGNISRWDTSRVVHMDALFQGSAFSGDISEWNTSRVFTATDMFRSSQFNGDIEKWDVRNCSNFIRMFQDSPFDGKLDRWQLQNAKEMEAMFLRCPFKGDLSRLKMSWTQSCKRMFSSTFEGVLPRAERLGRCQAFYNALFAETMGLTEYLQRTPFSAAHADLLLSTASRPSWATTAQFRWVRDQKKLGEAIGMNPEGLREFLVDAWHGGSKPPGVNDEEKVSFVFEMPDI